MSLLLLKQAPAIAAGGGGGSFTDGDSVSLSITGAGTKTTPGPYAYYDPTVQSLTLSSSYANNGAVALSVGSNGTWNAIGTNAGSMTNQIQTAGLRTSTSADRLFYQALTAVASESSGWGMGINIGLGGLTSTDQLYLNLWHRMSYNQGAGTNTNVIWNMKPWIIYSNSRGGGEFYVGFDSGSPSSITDMTLRSGGNAGSPTQYSSKSYWNNYFEDAWLCWEHEFTVGSGTSGGHRLWIHDETPSIALDMNDTTMATWATGNDWDFIRIGEYFRYAQMEYWTECFYMDTTFQRLMIGNASTYAACTRREVQRCTAWSSDAITFNLRSGGIDATGDMWAYAIDSSGSVVNSSGVHSDNWTVN